MPDQPDTTDTTDRPGQRGGRASQRGGRASQRGDRRHRRDADLQVIARAASREAGDVPEELLGDYLPAVQAAARTGRRLTATELAGYSRSGELAAEQGVALHDLVDLYLSATWRLWRELPAGSTAELRDAGLAVLRAADDAVAATADGFEHRRLAVARHQEAERIGFFDDLLSGRGTMAELIDRGERYGLRLAGPHQVVLAELPPTGVGESDREVPAASQASASPAAASRAAASRAAATAAAPAPALVAAREGRLVAVIGAAGGAPTRAARAIAAELSAELSRSGAAATGRAASRRDRPWRIAVGRAHHGPSGVTESYEEAREALAVADRLGLDDRVVDAADLLIYRVLLRDRAAITDLVGAVLTPLLRARNGAGPLLATLDAYYASGANAAAAARRMHLSVRAVTYRLARIQTLTGREPTDPQDALALQVAVIGARLLDWPATPLPAASAPADAVAFLS